MARLKPFCALAGNVQGLKAGDNPAYALGIIKPLTVVCPQTRNSYNTLTAI